MPIWIVVLSWVTKLVLLLLIGLSVWSVSIMIDRRRVMSALQSEGPLDEARRLIQTASPAEIESWAKAKGGLRGGTLLAAMGNGASAPESIDRAVQGYLSERKLELEKGLTVLATLGSNAPFIGLFGTVLGIIQAFGELGQNTGGGTAGIMSAISEALVATAIGLLVAIPAVVAYNTFSKSLRRHLSECEILRDLWVARRTSER